MCLSKNLNKFLKRKSYILLKIMYLIRPFWNIADKKIQIKSKKVFSKDSNGNSNKNVAAVGCTY